MGNKGCYVEKNLSKAADYFSCMNQRLEAINRRKESYRTCKLQVTSQICLIKLSSGAKAFFKQFSVLSANLRKETI